MSINNGGVLVPTVLSSKKNENEIFVGPKQDLSLLCEKEKRNYIDITSLGMLKGIYQGY